MNKNLAELLRQKNARPAAGPEINWDERRDTYLAAVAGLYAQVETILAEPIRQSLVTPRRHPKTLSEDYIGSYAVDDLYLRIGDEQVRFSPRGRNVAGAEGRVDVVGERATAVVVLRPGAGWQVVETRVPSLRTAPLDEGTLAELLREVMRE